MPTLVEAFVRHLERNRSPRTAKAYGEVAAAFFAHLGKKRVPDRKDVEAYILRPRAPGVPYAPTTRNQQLCALRALSSFAVAEGRWPSDPTLGLLFVREPPRQLAVLAAQEATSFFRALERVSRPRDLARDHAILVFLFILALRVHELVALDLDQVDTASGTLVGLRGKGGRVEDLYFDQWSLELVKTWIAERASRTREGERALFVSKRGTRLSIRGVQLLFERLRRATGTKKRVTPHTARRSAATIANRRGVGVASLSEFLRHADIKTTQLYLILAGEGKREAVQALSSVIPEELRVPVSSSSEAQLNATSGVARFPSSESPAVQPLNPAPIGRSIAANDNGEKPIDAHCRLGAEKERSHRL